MNHILELLCCYKQNNQPNTLSSISKLVNEILKTITKAKALLKLNPLQLFALTFREVNILEGAYSSKEFLSGIVSPRDP